MLAVDRLVDGINGNDIEGARLYMAQLGENEVLSHVVILPFSSCISNA